MAKNTKTLFRQIEDCKKRIAAERDKLRDLVDDANSIKEDCDEAINLLESAADALSKYL